MNCCNIIPAQAMKRSVMRCRAISAAVQATSTFLMPCVAQPGLWPRRTPLKRQVPLSEGWRLQTYEEKERMTTTTNGRLWIGKDIKRHEDPDLLMGTAQYTNDMKVAG